MAGGGACDRDRGIRRDEHNIAVARLDGTSLRTGARRVPGERNEHEDSRQPSAYHGVNLRLHGRDAEEYVSYIAGESKGHITQADPVQVW